MRPVVLILSLAAPTMAAAHPAVGIVVDRSGLVFYSDTERVWAIRSDGTKAVVVADVHAHELRLDAEGTLYHQCRGVASS